MKLNPLASLAKENAIPTIILSTTLVAIICVLIFTAPGQASSTAPKPREDPTPVAPISTHERNPDYYRPRARLPVTQQAGPRKRAPGRLRSDMLTAFEEALDSDLVLLEDEEDLRLFMSWVARAGEDKRTLPGDLYLESRDDANQVRRYRLEILDKIAGYMFLNHISPRGKMFYTTGRLTSEMVIKTVQMEIPILMSRSGFTAWGVELARQANLTLIGRAKGKRFVALSGEQRIVYDADLSQVWQEPRAIQRKAGLADGDAA